MLYVSSIVRLTWADYNMMDIFTDTSSMQPTVAPISGILIRACRGPTEQLDRLSWENQSHKILMVRSTIMTGKCYVWLIGRASLFTGAGPNEGIIILVLGDIRQRLCSMSWPRLTSLWLFLYFFHELGRVKSTNLQPASVTCNRNRLRKVFKPATAGFMLTLSVTVTQTQ